MKPTGKITTPPMRTSAGASHGSACSVVCRRACRFRALLRVGATRTPPGYRRGIPYVSGIPRHPICLFIRLESTRSVGLGLDFLQHVGRSLGLDLPDERLEGTRGLAPRR